jgi:hypothetical protein
VVRVLEGLPELDMPPIARLLAAITEHSDEVSIQEFCVFNCLHCVKFQQI